VRAAEAAGGAGVMHVNRLLLRNTVLCPEHSLLPGHHGPHWPTHPAQQISRLCLVLPQSAAACQLLA